MKIRHSAILAALVGLVGCHITAPPDPDGGLGARAQVYAPVLDEEIGELFVDRDGLWAFRTPDSRQVANYELGQLVAFGDLDDEHRHLFAVVGTDAWGVRLQRLDTERVEGRGAGSLVPIHSLDEPTAKRWGFCAGSGDPTQSGCIADSAAGTRWWIYGLSDGLVHLAERPRPPVRARPTLPVELVGSVTNGMLYKEMIGADLPSTWLAVPGPAGPGPTRPRIVTASDCNHGSPFRDVLGAEWTTADFDPPEDAVQVSDRAYATGADTLVWCDGDAVKVAVPTLFRPRLPIPGRGFSAPPLIGIQTIKLRGDERAATDWVARLGAATATGDYATADFAAEQLIRRTQKSKRIDGVLVDAMMAVAASGRPEAAARLGRYATRLDWNPENSPAWLLGMSIVEDRLGNTKSAVARTAELTELLQRVSEEEIHAWVLYFWTLDQASSRTKAGKVYDRLDAHPKFALVARADQARRLTPEKLPGLESQFARAGATALYDAMSGEVGEFTCKSSGGCAADSYGRLWANGAVEPAALSHVARIELSPGYRLDSLPAADGPMGRLRLLMAAYPLFGDNERKAAVEQATDASLEWVAEHCTPGATNRESVKEELAVLRREGIDSALRMDDWHSDPLDATMAWLPIDGVPAACQGTEQLAARGEELAGDVGVDETPTRFLALHVERASPTELPETLAIAADFATRFERGPKCAVWNTALAAAFAETGRHELATKYTKASAHCDVADRYGIDLVSAYLNFQRTGSISLDYDRPVRERLALIAGSKVASDVGCVGMLPLRYELAPGLDDEVASIVDRLPLDRPDEPNELSIVSATDRLLIASEHLVDTWAHFGEQKPKEAARSLGFARDAFSALDHQPGLARVRWLDETLFAGRSTEVADGTAEFQKVGPAELQNAELKGVAAAPEAPLRFRLAAALLQGSQEEAVEFDVSTLESRATLCEIPRREERGTVLDRKDGQLQGVE